MEEHMRKNDTIEVVKKGEMFKVRILDDHGNVIMEGTKGFSVKANAKLFVKAFAVRHNKFSFDTKITDAPSATFGNHVRAAYDVGSRDD
jgi:hypothetical protein